MLPKTKLRINPLSARLFAWLSGKTISKTSSPTHTNKSLINVFPFLDSGPNCEQDCQTI